MKILFAGDSITRGNIGRSYVDLFRKEFPGRVIHNLGKNGDTLVKITHRLLNELHNKPDYTHIILQAGYNDILLPIFKTRSKLFKKAYERQISVGQLPLSSDDFGRHLQEVVEEIQLISNAKIILTTLGCVDEKPGDELKCRRSLYNKKIAEVAASTGTMLADCGKLFDEITQNTTKTRPYLIDSLWNVTVNDRIFSLFNSGPDYLSRRRKLFLTIDGVHLNSSGAQLFHDEIFRHIFR